MTEQPDVRSTGCCRQQTGRTGRTSVLRTFLYVLAAGDTGGIIGACTAFSRSVVLRRRLDRSRPRGAIMPPTDPAPRRHWHQTPGQPAAAQGNRPWQPKETVAKKPV